MNHDTYSKAYIRDILEQVSTVAIVGTSPKPERPSYGVMQFMREKGYAVIPVNPGFAGGEIAGLPVFASLADLPRPVDMVDIFRASAAVPGLTAEILAMPVLPAVVWMQLGIRDDASAARLEAAGIRVVMNRCPKIEIMQQALVS